MRRAFAVIAAASVLAQEAYCSSTPPLPVARGMNIHFSGPGLDNEISMLSEAASIARMDLKWDETETSRGVYNFSAYDELQAAMAAKDVRLWLILDYSNPIYCPNGMSPITPEQQAAFAKWGAAAAAHYASRPSFPAPVYEIYNEANIAFWKPKPNATQYGSLAIETAKAIKAAAPAAWVVAPCTSGIDLDFIRTTFEMGLAGLVDAVGVHPYRRGGPESVVADYEGLRSLIANFTPPGGKGPVVISSEWGWTTCKSPCTPPGPQASEADQAAFAVRRFLIDAWQDVPISIDYEWRDGGDNGTMREQNFGCVTADYRADNSSYPFLPKPAFFAMRTHHSMVAGATFKSRLAAGGTGTTPGGIYAMDFEGASGDRVVAAWTMGALDQCPSANPRRDCGFFGISKDQCQARGCCYSPSKSDPWCFYPTGSGTVTAQLPLGAPQGTCFTRTALDGTPLSKVCAATSGNVTVDVTAAPVFLRA